MNDRYLFKAKGESTEKWYIGLLTRADSDICWIKTKDGEYVCKTSTICQCTGLKDKNGNLIWENDVIKYTDDIINKEKVDRIRFNETHASFTRVHKSKMGLQYLYINEGIANKSEVIGNIFDNPELLEVE